MTKIVIIEDDQVINQMYRMKFEASGFDVSTASDGESGIAVSEKIRPDIILLDIQMPHMNGDAALEKIRATSWGKQTPVFILTNVGKEEAPARLKDLDVARYIVKAERTPSQVVAEVKEVLSLA